LNIYPKTDSNGNTTGYSASNTISVDLHQVLKSGRLITRVTAAGANLESGPTFSLEKTDLTYEKALNEALDKAHSKAASMAGHVGLSLGKPATINEGAQNVERQYLAPTMATSKALDISGARQARSHRGQRLGHGRLLRQLARSFSRPSSWAKSPCLAPGLGRAGR